MLTRENAQQQLRRTAARARSQQPVAPSAAAATFEEALALALYADGSSPILNSAMRLCTLPPDSDAHAEAVELVKADIEQFARVTDADFQILGKYCEFSKKTMFPCPERVARDPKYLSSNF